MERERTEADTHRDVLVPAADAWRELKRLLADPQFQCTDRNKRFLKFVAKRSLAGRDGSIKAYTIAVDVFGRPTSFDPTTDPIVRIEATRLRGCLERYYERFGSPGRVRIELPKGKYVPHFSRAVDEGQRNRAEERDTAAARLGDPLLRRQQAMKRVDWRVAGIGAAIAVMLCLAWYRGFPGPVAPITSKPFILVEVTAAAAAPEAVSAFRDRLVSLLAAGQTVRIREPGFEATAASVASSGVPDATTDRYVLAVNFHSKPTVRTSWRLTDTETGELVASQTLDTGEDEVAAADIATRVAATNGLIQDREMIRALARPSLGYGCVLRASLALETGDRSLSVEATRCLKATIRAVPSSADAHALLSMLFLSSYGTESDAAGSPQALALAEKAVAISPTSTLALLAAIEANFRAGNMDAAMAAGRAALAAGSNDPRIVAKLGKVMVLGGDWKTGTALIRSAGFLPGAQPDAEIALAIDAYRLGNDSNCLDHVALSGNDGAFLPRVLRAAALGRLGEKRAARDAIDQLRIRRMDSVADVRSQLASWKVAPSLAAAIANGLTAAGLPADHRAAATAGAE